MRLTVKERILLHLFELTKHAEAVEVPPTLTQEGIAQSCWIDVPHFAQYVRPLIRDGLLRERMAHVKKTRKRRKVYDLTDAGRMAAVKLRDTVRSEMVRVRDGGVVREATVSQVLRELAGEATLLGVLRNAAESGIVDIAALSAPLPAQLVEMITEKPRIEGFVGRRTELEAIVAEGEGPRVLLVRGVAGIGKSSLAAEACELLHGKKNLFWHRVRSWDTHLSILAALGDFLSALGRPGLKSVLSRGEVGRASQVLREDLPGTRAFLIFDDAHEAGADALSLFRLLKDSIAEAPDVRLLVLTRKALPFYDRRDVVLHGFVREIDLSGLEPEEVIAFLSAEPERAQLADFGRQLGGHPLFLELLRAAGGPAVASHALRDVRRFVEEQIYMAISDAERSMMKIASLYSLPVPREAFLSSPGLSHEVLVSLTQRSLIRPVGEGTFEVHDTIRDFFVNVLSASERLELGGFAVEQLQQLASKAQAAGGLVACVDYLSNALRLSKPGKEQVALVEALAESKERIGDLAGALTAYREAMKATTEPVVLARLHRKVASALENRGEVAAASVEIDAGLRALGDAVEVERGWLHLVKCRVAAWREEWEEAKEHGDGALRIFQILDVPQGQARALLALGILEGSSPDGDPSVEERNLSAALDFASSIADAELTAEVRMAMAGFYGFLYGPVERGLDHIAAIEALPEAMDKPFIRKNVLILKGWITLHSRVDLSAARSNFAEASALARLVHDPAGVLEAKVGLAIVTYYEGRIREAREQFEEVIAVEGERSFPGSEVEIMQYLAECCLLLEDLESFHRVITAFEDPRLARGVELRIVTVKIWRGIDRLIRGDREGCRTAFAEAIQSARYPELFFALFYYGVALRVMGRDREASEHIDRARELVATHGHKSRLSVMDERARLLTEILQRASDPFHAAPDRLVSS